MALIKCPECGKEISDTVNKCVNCGYLLKTKRKINDKVIICGGVISVLVVLCIVFGFINKQKNPFLKFNCDMTKSQVRTECGEPYASGDSTIGITYDYYDEYEQSFLGYEGIFHINYVRGNNRITSVTWSPTEYIEDTDKFLQKIKDYFGKKYGNPKYDDGWSTWVSYIWKDDENTYSLIIRHDDAIEIVYEPEWIVRD